MKLDVFKKHLNDQQPYIHAYIYDIPSDYIGDILKLYPIAEYSIKPLYKTGNITYMATRTAFLLYYLHKLEVRPK